MQVHWSDRYGEIVLGFYPSVAPVTVAHILRLVRMGGYNTNEIFRVDKGFVAQIQSGDDAIKFTEASDVLYVAAGADPYELLSSAFRTVSDTLGTFDVASRKAAPADVDHFGWCTWDAFYQAVDPSGIQAGLRSLHKVGAPPRTLIIDDGWQTVVQDGGSELGETVAAELEALPL